MITKMMAIGPFQAANPNEPSNQNITERLPSAESEEKIRKLVAADSM